jgi:VHS domain
MNADLEVLLQENWRRQHPRIVLELCEHASANEAAAKKAVRALRREFKYADPSAQLTAARLWAIMLQNCSEEFIEQSASRKSLDAVEDVIINNRTNPVVRERFLEVLGSAVYHHTKNDRTHPFAVLWRKVKPRSAPEQVRCLFLFH